MRSAANSARPAKREVIQIDDDESTNDQPAMKTVKREEEIAPASEVAELQKKVLKLEDTLQRAYRAAGTAQLRAEAAENRLDDKYGIKDGFVAEKERAGELEKRVNDLSLLVATERQQAIDNQERDRARIDELTQKLSQYEDGQQLLHNIMQSLPPPPPPAQLQLLLPPPPPPPALQLLQQQQHTQDLERRVNDLSMLLATEQQQAIDNGSRDRARLEEVSMQLELEKIKVSELTRQNIELNKSLAIRSDSELQKRNDELTRRLAQYEGALAPLLQLQQQQPMLHVQQLQKTQALPQMLPVVFKTKKKRERGPASSPGSRFNFSSSVPSTSVSAAAAATTQAAAPPSNNNAYRHRTGHPTNLYQLCHPDSSDAMMLNEARVVLTAASQKDRELLKLHGTMGTDMKLECEMCHKFLTKYCVVQHFLSKTHQNNVTAARASVSRHAVAYWAGKLTSAADRSVRIRDADAADVAAARPMQNIQAAATPAAPQAAAAPPSNNHAYLHRTGHPTNILQPCHPDSGDAMIFNKAHIVLSAAYQKDRELARLHGNHDKVTGFECCMCAKSFSSVGVMQHFFSKKHQNNAIAARADVSRHAVAYWVERLTNAAGRSVRMPYGDNAAATRPMQPPTAAAAAPARAMQQDTGATADAARPVHHSTAATAAATRSVQQVSATTARPTQPTPAAAATRRPMQPPTAAAVAAARSMQHVHGAFAAASRPAQQVPAATAAAARPTLPPPPPGDSTFTALNWAVVGKKEELIDLSD